MYECYKVHAMLCEGPNKGMDNDMYMVVNGVGVCPKGKGKGKYANVNEDDFKAKKNKVLEVVETIRV